LIHQPSVPYGSLPVRLVADPVAHDLQCFGHHNKGPGVDLTDDLLEPRELMRYGYQITREKAIIDALRKPLCI
jgi:hypothetical protein